MLREKVQAKHSHEVELYRAMLATSPNSHSLPHARLDP